MRRVGVLVVAAVILPAQNYREFKGQHKRFCGEVVEVSHPFRKCEAALLLGNHADRWRFAAVISPDARATLPKKPHEYLFNDICVAGVVTEEKKKPYILVERADQLEVRSAPQTSFGTGAVTSCDEGVVPPRPTRQPRPIYTRQAMQDKAKGLVVTQVVVSVDGSVTEARIVRSLHPDLDRAALDTARAWHFEAGTRDGVPVPSLVDIEFTFTLR